MVSISAVLALLPDGYKVKINTEKYNEMVAENKVITCKCGEVTQYDQIKIEKLLLATTTAFISQKEYEKYWKCPKCQNYNQFDRNSVKIRKYQMPFYTGFMPEAPTKKPGISDRRKYVKEFKNWYAIAIDELESKIGKYRADYIAQLEGDEIDIPEEKHDE